jgi:hypothetical protein
LLASSKRVWFLRRGRNITPQGEAIKAAKQLVDGHDVELWQRDRKIERFNRPG